ncbi:porin family protein [Helicobacter cetorum]|uniref:Putative outer membrane protein HomB n=1 Tax=Helicobacter cetorum (strain ATCC BAA-540 / CCUG 52418 / MIT 99-5656) TaxID=1163745 RepID=I0EUP9_HELCM|nr:membrane protein [Helicobacter cetorum]AFI06668.1 putative outer membrane protein HomB [Helicobacter cetorum MIT 99-5656]
MQNFRNNLTHLSKSVCLALVGLWSNLEAHPKSGFFIQAGFETGMSSITESVKKRPNPQSIIGNGLYQQGYQPRKTTKEESTSRSNHSHEAHSHEESETPSQVSSGQTESTQQAKNTEQESTTASSAVVVEGVSEEGQHKTSEQKDQAQADAPAQPDPVATTQKQKYQEEIERKNQECQERVKSTGQTCAPLYTGLDHSTPSYANISANGVTLSHVNVVSSETTTLFTDSNVVGQTFSTTNPIATTFDASNSTIHIKNSLPYDLKNVKLVVKVADSGNSKGYRDVALATFDNIPKNSHITLDKSKISAFSSADIQAVNTQNFEFRYDDTQNSSDPNDHTKRVLEAIDKITTNINGTFQSGNGCPSYNSNPGCLDTPTAQQAQNYVNMYLNLAGTLDSQVWKDAMLGANFKFHGSSDSVQFDDIDKQSLIDQFRQDSNNLAVRVVRNGGAFGWANRRSMAVNASFVNPNYNDLLRTYNENITNADIYRYMFHTFFHEFGHTKGWGHDSNLTYSEYYHLGGGFSSVTTDAWLKLANSNELPINYQDLPANYGGGSSSGGPWGSVSAKVSVAHQLENQKIAGNDPSKLYPYGYGYPYYGWGYNSPTRDPYYDDCNPNLYNCADMALQDVPKGAFENALNTMSATLLESVQALQNKALKNPTLGFNTQIGYQNYFNNIIGLSYYAMFNYNYSKRQGLLNKTQQYGVGGGVNLLIDFINVYKDKNFKSSFGVFAGARALYNRYQFNGMINASKHKGNVYFTTGFNYRYKHSKISLGISMPLIKQNIKAQLLTEETINEVALNENFNNMHVFMNYGWVF